MVTIRLILGRRQDANYISDRSTNEGFRKKIPKLWSNTRDLEHFQVKKLHDLLIHGKAANASETT